jgi:hypothetical protein
MSKDGEKGLKTGYDGNGCGGCMKFVKYQKQMRDGHSMNAT